MIAMVAIVALASASCDSHHTVTVKAAAARPTTTMATTPVPSVAPTVTAPVAQTGLPTVTYQLPPACDAIGGAKPDSYCRNGEGTGKYGEPGQANIPAQPGEPWPYGNCIFDGQGKAVLTPPRPVPPYCQHSHEHEAVALPA